MSGLVNSRSPPLSGELPTATDRLESVSQAPAQHIDSSDSIDQVLIHNPLLSLSDDQLHHHAKAFYDNGKLADVVDFDVFLRGAKIAKDPSRFESIPGLTAIERDSLRKERDATFWQQIKALPKEFRIILVTCCIAAIVQGWNQSNIAGANLAWPNPRQGSPSLANSTHSSDWTNQNGLGLNGWDSSTLINPNFNKKNAVHAVWTFGAINAASYLSAALLGCWLSDPLCEHFYGRRGALSIAAVFSFAAAVGGAYVQTIGQLAVCRVLTGIGMGAKASVVPIFAAETAPHRIRGSLVITWQTFDALGIMLGYAADLVVIDSWRKQIASAFIPAVPLLILVPLCVESPRWLYKKNKVKQSYLAFKLLRDTPIQACRDLYYCHAQLQMETKYFRRESMDHESGTSEYSKEGLPTDIYVTAKKQTVWFSRFLQLFRNNRTRRAAVQAFLAMFFQQASGINVMAFLAPTVFADALRRDGPQTPAQQRSGALKALWMSFGFGLANFLFTWPAWGTIDKKGRRFLLNLSLWNMAWTMLGLGLAFLIHEDSPARIPVIIIFVLLFTLAYSPGAGPLAFTISAEVFPLINREVGMSLAVFVNLLGAGLLALLVPILAKKLTHAGLLGMFAGFNVICAIVAFFLIRETATYSLEDLNQIFEIPTWTHIQYQWYRIRQWIRNHRQHHHHRSNSRRATTNGGGGSGDATSTAAAAARSVHIRDAVNDDADQSSSSSSSSAGSQPAFQDPIANWVSTQRRGPQGLGLAPMEPLEPLDPLDPLEMRVREGGR